MSSTKEWIIFLGWYIGLTLTYFGLVCLTAALSQYTAPDTNSNFFRVIYYSQQTNTEYFDFSKLFLWLLTIPFGFIYVNKLVLKKNRFVMAGDEEYKSFFITLLFCFVIFFLSPIMMIRGYYDKDEFCRHQSDKNVPDDDIFGVAKGCERRDYWNIVVFNFFCIGVPFLIGCHFTYLDKPPFNRISLEISFIREWRCEWITVTILLLVLLFDIGYLFYIYWLIDKIYWYIGYIFAMAIYIFTITVIFRKSRRLHLHHYAIFAFFITLIGSQNYFTAIQFGLFTGIMIEGAARWGCDETWKPHRCEKVSEDIIDHYLQLNNEQEDNKNSNSNHEENNGNLQSSIISHIKNSCNYFINKSSKYLTNS